MGLLFRCHRIGRGVQIHAVFAQRFAVVGHIPQGGVGVFLLAQKVDGGGQHVIDVENGVVISVAQGFLVAILNLVGVACGREFTQIIGVALIISGAVAAHGVQHNHAVGRHCLNFLRQPLEQHHIQAALAAALAFFGQFAHINMFDAVAHAFAAAVVFTPAGVKPHALQHIQQAFLMTGAVAVVIAAAHLGKHARHGNGGGGAA